MRIRKDETLPHHKDLARYLAPLTLRKACGTRSLKFTLSSREGAVLILPEGAERCYLRNERPFLKAAMQHAVDWYTFAEQRLGRIISHDSLYLITGFHKARSWSLAAYQQGAGTGETSARFKATQVGSGNIPACYTWETTEAVDWRVGPSNLCYNGIPNQSVFINGFKIAIREGILGSKWVTVKADIPSVKPCYTVFSSGPSNLWRRVFGSTGGSTSNTSRWTGTSSNSDNDLVLNQPCDNADGDITIHRFPQVTKPFHPSDVINQHLLLEMPSATVAVTHDSQWTTLPQNGSLKPDELLRDCLIAEVTSNYIPVLAHEGAVYLESRAMEVDIGVDAVDTTSPEPKEHLDLSPPSHDTQPSDSDPLIVDMIDVNPESSHAIRLTIHKSQEHVTPADVLPGHHAPGLLNNFRCQSTARSPLTRSKRELLGEYRGVESGQLETIRGIVKEVTGQESRTRREILAKATEVLSSEFKKQEAAFANAFAHKAHSSDAPRFVSCGQVERPEPQRFGNELSEAASKKGVTVSHRGTINQETGLSIS